MRLLLLSFILLFGRETPAQHPHIILQVEGLEFMLFGPEKNAFFGVLTNRGSVFIEPRYAALSDFGADGAAAILDTVCGFVFSDGTECWFPQFQKLYRLQEGLAPAQKDNKWGFVDKKGRTVIPFKYDMVLPFYEGYAPVMLNNQWKIVDKKGRYLLKDRYEFDGKPVFDGKLVFISVDSVSGRKKKGMMNTRGKVLVPARYDDVAGFFAQGLCWVQKDNQQGFVNESGEEILIGDYVFPVQAFDEGFTPAVKNGRTGYFDAKGHLVIPFDYSNGGRFSEGLAAVVKDRKLGFINRQNELVIPFAFGEAWESGFQEGLSAVKDLASGKFGYIDKTGRMVIPAIYDSALQFSDGLGFVRKDKKAGFIDHSGQPLIGLQYDEIWYFRRGLARFSVTK